MVQYLKALIAIHDINMFRKIIPRLSRTGQSIRAANSTHHFRLFSSAVSHRVDSDPLPSVLADVISPIDITTVLSSGKGFKIRTLQDPEPRTIHGNLFVVEGEYFLWRPQLYSPRPGVLDISPESWGILDVVIPKPGAA